MKFSGKIEDGTSNKPLNFGSDPWPVCLPVSILLENLRMNFDEIFSKD